MALYNPRANMANWIVENSSPSDPTSFQHNNRTYALYFQVWNRQRGIGISQYNSICQSFRSPHYNYINSVKHIRFFVFWKIRIVMKISLRQRYFYTATANFPAVEFPSSRIINSTRAVSPVHWALLTELYYIWRKHANLFSVKQLKPKTWRIFVEFDVILRHFYGNG